MSDKTWAMNCVLAGVETAIFMRQGHPDLAREKLATLTSELTPEDVEHLMCRIQDLLQAQARQNESQNPYPETIIVEAYGIEVLNELHRAWEEGNRLRKTAEAQGYEEWALKVLLCICNETRVDLTVKVAEIMCVLRRDGHYPESYDDGDTPEEAWGAELQAIADSQ